MECFDTTHIAVPIEFEARNYFYVIDFYYYSCDILDNHLLPSRQSLYLWLADPGKIISKFSRDYL